MTTIAVITGSVRPGRAGSAVARWIAEKANEVDGVDARVLELADFDLPVFAEEVPPMMAPAKDPAAVAWNKALAGFDAFIFVTPEYNHSVPGALKNAIDFIAPSVLANRAVGLVGYSYSAGHRPIEHLRSILANFTTGVVGARQGRQRKHGGQGPGHSALISADVRGAGERRRTRTRRPLTRTRGAADPVDPLATRSPQANSRLR